MINNCKLFLVARFSFVVPAGVSCRLDAFVAGELPHYSRSFVADKCHLHVNDASAKPATKVTGGDTVVVGVPRLADLTIAPEPIALDIVFEDADILVVNKPAGMVVHPTDYGGHVTGTLVNALLYYLQPKQKRAKHSKNVAPISVLERGKDASTVDRRPGLVHRLDRETSGLLVVAKTDIAKEKLTKQFAARTVEKEYLALVVGRLPTDTGRIDAPIARGATDRTRREVRVAPDAREAVTEFAVAERFTDTTLVRVHILTGRTHQIRVHFASIHHPVVGDQTYGHPAVNAKHGLTRQFLHAAKLSFVHPTTGQRVTFEVPLPTDLAACLAQLHAA